MYTITINANDEILRVTMGTTTLYEGQLHFDIDQFKTEADAIINALLDYVEFEDNAQINIIEG